MAMQTIQSPNAPIALPPTLAFIVGAPAAPRRAVEALIEAAINELDTLDGDIDLLDTNDAEDDFARTTGADAYAAECGPGCPIADNDHEHDGCEEERGL